MLHIVNLALRFVLELFAVASIADWAYQAPLPLPFRILAGVAAAAILVTAWGAFLAPTARRGLSHFQKDVLGTLVLLVASVALFATGQSTLAVIFAAAIVVNAALLLAFRHRPTPTMFSGPRN